MDEEILKKLHNYSIDNKILLENSNNCICFYCKKKFNVNEIIEWISDFKKKNNTALCPYCKIDSVIGDACEYTLSDKLIDKMHNRFFRNCKI